MNHLALPKVELHRHLEGSLRLQTLIDLAALHGRALPATSLAGLRKHAQVLEPMGSLQEVLDAFDLFQDAFRSLDAVERLTYEAVEDAALDGVCLLELRFSPGFMAEPAGLDWDEMMARVLRGVERARAKYDIVVGLIADLLERGACVTLNSDDPGLFDITLSGELALAQERLGFSASMLLSCTRNAMDASFVSEAEKAAPRIALERFREELLA
jgi:adenosine deaminase